MKGKSSLKKKIITTLCVIGGIVLLVGSFFLRDLFLRAGIVEYDAKDILQVKNKYSASLNAVAEEGMGREFAILSKHGGLFEKSQIETDDNGKAVYEKLKSHIDVLCHSYCYSIKGDKTAVTFSFNEKGTKMLVYSETAPEKQNETDIINDLKDNWYYVEIGEQTDDE